jgi:hypothetical protein
VADEVEQGLVDLVGVSPDDRVLPDGEKGGLLFFSGVPVQRLAVHSTTGEPDL